MVRKRGLRGIRDSGLVCRLHAAGYTRGLRVKSRVTRRMRRRLIRHPWFGDEGIVHPTPCHQVARRVRGATSGLTEKRRHATTTAKRGVACGSGRYAHCFASVLGREDLGPPTPSRAGIRPEARLGHGVRPRPRVLIVDDDVDTRDLYAWCMIASGWLVHAVANGAEALIAAPVVGPDVIVMDLHMPVLGGLDAIREIKRNDATKHVPIVACTALDRRSSEIDAMVAGCDEFVPQAVRARSPSQLAGAPRNQSPQRTHDTYPRNARRRLGIDGARAHRHRRSAARIADRSTRRVLGLARRRPVLAGNDRRRCGRAGRRGYRHLRDARPAPDRRAEIVRNRQAGSGVKGIAAPRSRGVRRSPSPPAPFPRGVGAALLCAVLAKE